MCPAAACPMCGQVNEATVENAPATCARCGAVLGHFDSVIATPNAAAGSAHATATPAVASEWAEFIRAVLPKALLAAAVCAAGGVGVAILLAPVLGENFRLGIVGAAYFGGQLGLVFAFLWFGLDQLNGQLIGGAILGVCIGLVIGLVNLVALSQTSYLPDVTVFEGMLVGVLAGLVTGIFVAMLRGDT